MSEVIAFDPKRRARSRNAAGTGMSWPHDVVPLQALIWVMACNMSAAMMLANPFVAASMVTLLNQSSTTASPTEN